MLGVRLEIMEEGEQKVCLAEPTLELMEEMLLQVQMQLLGAMQVLEALAAEAVLEALVEMAWNFPLLMVQGQKEVKVERVVMAAAAAAEETEGGLLLTLNRQG